MGSTEIGSMPRARKRNCAISIPYDDTSDRTRCTPRRSKLRELSEYRITGAGSPACSRVPKSAGISRMMLCACRATAWRAAASSKSTFTMSMPRAAR
jgi:hypothetical protein